MNGKILFLILVISLVLISGCSEKDKLVKTDGAVKEINGSTTPSEVLVENPVKEVEVRTEEEITQKYCEKDEDCKLFVFNGCGCDPCMNLNSSSPEVIAVNKNFNEECEPKSERLTCPACSTVTTIGKEKPIPLCVNNLCDKKIVNIEEPIKEIEVEPRYPEDFNVIYSYEFDERQINLKGDKYAVGGCYPKTNFSMPFNVEDKNRIYDEVVNQNLLDYNWTFIAKYLRKNNLTCWGSTTNGDLFSIKISINNKSNEIVTDARDCCCFSTYDKDGYVDEHRQLNESEMNDPLTQKIYNQEKELRRFSNEIESMINSKKITFNITEPKPDPDCGYI